MPDVTLCKGIQPLLNSDEICPKREFCWRYTAKPDKVQSYFLGMPYSKKNQSCEFYLDNEDYEYDKTPKYF